VDQKFKILLLNVCVIRRGPAAGEECGSYFVDNNIRALSREHGGNKEFDWCREIKLAMGGGINPWKLQFQGLSPFLACHAKSEWENAAEEKLRIFLLLPCRSAFVLTFTLSMRLGLNHIFHHREFSDAEELVRKKNGNTIALVIPTLNESETIADIVTVLRTALMERVQLLDRIVVVDSGSSDDTSSLAREAGAEVITASEVLPELAAASGKGENLYKATYAVDADILCFLDGDIRQMDPRFVCGLVGPLLCDREIQFVKAYYDRPAQAAEKGARDRPQGGGRVTEILVRPLFSLFRPNLSRIIQPLSGEYAARRSLLCQLPFPVGYGVEMAHLLDIESRYGMDVIAQTDLEERIHRHHGTAELGRMAFAILQVFIRRLPPQALTLFPDGNLPEIYRTFLLKSEVYEEIVERRMELERPPLNTLQLR